MNSLDYPPLFSQNKILEKKSFHFYVEENTYWDPKSVNNIKCLKSISFAHISSYYQEYNEKSRRPDTGSRFLLRPSFTGPIEKKLACNIHYCQNHTSKVPSSPIKPYMFVYHHEWLFSQVSSFP